MYEHQYARDDAPDEDDERPHRLAAALAYELKGGCVNGCRRPSVSGRPTGPDGQRIEGPFCGRCYGKLEYANNPRYREAIARGTRLYDARRRGATPDGAERFTVDEIGQRDGWICQLCLEPVDPASDRKSADGASVDHIVPVSKDGEHTRENAWLAHKSCNSVKGDRTDLGRGDLAREPRIPYRLTCRASRAPFEPLPAEQLTRRERRLRKLDGVGG